MFCTMMLGFARDVFGQVFGKQARAEVVVVPGREAGDETYLLVLIEILRACA
jgi:hypothetical protein